MQTVAMLDQKKSVQLEPYVEPVSDSNPTSKAKDRKARKKKQRSKARKRLGKTSLSVTNPEKRLSSGKTMVNPLSGRRISGWHELNTPACRSVVPVHSRMFQSWIEESGSIGQAFIKDLVNGSAYVPEWMKSCMTQLALPSIMTGYRQTGAFTFNELPIIFHRNSTRYYSQLSFNDLVERVLEIPHDQYIIPDQQTLKWQKKSIKRYKEVYDTKNVLSCEQDLANVYINQAMRYLILPQSIGKETTQLNQAMKYFKRAQNSNAEIARTCLRIILGKYHLNKAMTGHVPHSFDLADMVKLFDMNLCDYRFPELLVPKLFYFSGLVPGYEFKGNVRRMGDIYCYYIVNNHFARFFDPVCFSLADYLLTVKSMEKKVGEIFKRNVWNTPPVVFINSFIYMSKFAHILNYGLSRELQDVMGFMSRTLGGGEHLVTSVSMLFLTFEFLFSLEGTRFPPMKGFNFMKENIRTLFMNVGRKIFHGYSKWFQCLGFGVYGLLVERQAKHSSSLRRTLNKEAGNCFEAAAIRGFIAHWGDAAQYYASSGFFEKAVCAAEHMYKHCEDELMKLHWEERVQSYQSLEKKKTTIPDMNTEATIESPIVAQKLLSNLRSDSLQPGTVKGMVSTNMSLLEEGNASQEPTTDPVAQSAARKKNPELKKRKKRGGKKSGKRTATQHAVEQDTMGTNKDDGLAGNDVTAVTGNVRPVTSVTLPSRPDRKKSGKHAGKYFDDFDIVISFVGKNKKNIVDVGRMYIDDIDEMPGHGSDGKNKKEVEWKMAAHKNKIVNIRRIHLMENWNPAVFTFLKNIDKARLGYDFQGEVDCVSDLLNKPCANAMLGIERCFEEIAWTLLHVFDDLFNSLTFFRMYEVNAIEEKLYILKMAKKFLLASIARYLNMDAINLNISLNEIKQMIEINVGKSINPCDDVQRQIVFRLSCLISSMGHYHSVSAFLSPTNNKSHKEHAIQYYNYKNYLKRNVSRRFDQVPVTLG